MINIKIFNCKHKFKYWINMDDQELMKNARTKNQYDAIWQNVGKCVFCDLNDKYIIHEEDGVVLTINLYPYIDGQMMAIPRRHVSSPKELSQKEWEALRKMSYIAKKLIKRAHGFKGMWNLIREGGEVANMTVTDHLHLQLIPFDAPDLCKWNYRELKYTPLQNITIYRKLKSEIKKNMDKYEEKYNHKTSLPIVCDLVIIHEGKVLFQKRKEESKIEDGYLTLPGGHVDNPEKGFIEDLIKEIKEEVDISIDKSNISLIDSRVGKVNYPNVNKYSNFEYLSPEMFVWNTYLYKGKIVPSKMKPGSECEEIMWLTRDEIQKNPHISPELKGLIRNLKL